MTSAHIATTHSSSALTFVVPTRQCFQSLTALVGRRRRCSRRRVISTAMTTTVRAGQGHGLRRTVHGAWRPVSGDVALLRIVRLPPAYDSLLHAIVATTHTMLIMTRRTKGGGERGSTESIRRRKRRSATKPSTNVSKSSRDNTYTAHISTTPHTRHMHATLLVWTPADALAVRGPRATTSVRVRTNVSNSCPAPVSIKASEEIDVCRTWDCARWRIRGACTAPLVYDCTTPARDIYTLHIWGDGQGSFGVNNRTWLRFLRLCRLRRTWAAQ